MPLKTTVHGEYIESMDGLRAIAVLAVLLFHLSVPGFGGGYVGVDTFFVISGFLITKNILSDVHHGKFSFSSFYLRRIARLFPALFLTVGVTLAASYWVLGPEDLASLGHVSILTVLSLSNVVFWLQSGYFDTAAAFKPLLHTWSLAVEEQFYLVWPITIWLSLKAGWRVAIAVIALAGALSLAAAIWIVPSHPNAVFFLTPFRVHQFALGALLAFVGIGGRTLIGSVATIIGLVIMLAVVGTASDLDQSYTYTAVMPAVAAAAIIWSLHSRVADVTLGSLPVRWIGKRSYSIYLVHWPIIVLWKMASDFSLSITEQVAAFILSIAAGALLHALVERPLRFHRGQTLRFRGGVMASVAALAVAVFIVGSHYWALDGFPNRVPAQLRAYAGGFQKEWNARKKALRTGECNFLVGSFRVEDFKPDICVNPLAGKPSYLVVGDSFASDAWPTIKVRPGWPVRVVVTRDLILRPHS